MKVIGMQERMSREKVELIYALAILRLSVSSYPSSFS